MSRLGAGTLRLVRSFLVFCLTVLLVTSVAFTGGTALANAVPAQFPENDNISESDGSDVVDVKEQDIPELQEETEAITGPEAQPQEGSEPSAPEPSTPELLQQQLNELTRAFAPLASGDNCNHANPGTGAYAETLCWLDFSGFTTEYVNHGSLLRPDWQSVMGNQYTAGGRSGDWGNIQNYPVRVDLGDGYVLTAQLDANGNNDQGKRIKADSFPTWSGAFLGNKNFYTGVPGRPALYQQDGRGDTTLKLKNIELQKDGASLRDFSVVVADAETTDSGEGIEWSTTGEGFKWLPNKPKPRSKADVMGNACSTATPAWNSTIPSPTASCSSNSNDVKTGTPLLATAPPVSGAFEITQRMTTQGGLFRNDRQGVAFGVIIGRAEVQTEVQDRIVNSANENVDPTNFTASIEQAHSGAEVVSTQTGATDLVSPAESVVLPVSSNGTRLHFASDASGSLASSYTRAWRCEKSDPETGLKVYWPSETTTSPTPPSDADPFSELRVGQLLRCKIVYTPPYLSLEKSVENTGTEALHTPADFTVKAVGQDDAYSSIEGLGNQDSLVTRRPVAIGEYLLQENGPDTETEGNWQYCYDWTDLKCVPGEESTRAGELKTTIDDSDVITDARLQIRAGNDISCTFYNTARFPELEASTDVFDADGALLDWDAPVSEGDVLSYRLTFNNSGNVAMDIDHRHYLGDVFDDATLIERSTRISDGQEDSYPESMPQPGLRVSENVDVEDPHLALIGRVLRGQTRTVWFRVEVLGNSEDVDARQKFHDDAGNTTSPVGYVLSSYLLPSDESVPTDCAEPEEGKQSNCTRNPVPAWTVEKQARPADGARLHKGGNTHYQIIAEKMNAATTISDLEFEDDLTHVFKTAGWAPGAAVPGGALKRGIYFFDAQDQSLDADGNPIGSLANPAAAFDENSGYVPEPVLEGERWILRSLPVTLPDNAMRAEMWFAVEAGQRPANIPPSWPGDREPAFGSRYVNYVRAQAGNDVPPNRCGLDTTVEPNTQPTATAPNPIDERVPEDCWVAHRMSDNYFTIRKDSRGAGVEFPASVSGWGDGTGLTNMVGHEFEIRDDIGGSPSEYPSVKLCRAEYHPAHWNGEFISGGTPDWGEGSETLAAIIEHNNALPVEASELPLCGLFYPQGTFGGQEHAGGQDGRWRSEYLSDGDYWLVETKAPDQQINNTGTALRQVPGVQLLANPIAFTVWPDQDAEFFGPQNPQQSMEGRGQLDIKGLERQRCSPGAPVGERPVACVNPTGYLMLVQDTVPYSLPLTGGRGTTWLLIAGGGILLVTALGIWNSRRKQSLDISGGANPM